MKHAEEFRFCVINIILRKFVRLFVTTIYRNLSTPVKNRSDLRYLRKVYPYSFCNGERNAFVITDAFCIMKFSADAVDTAFLRMKIIKTAFETDHEKEKQAGSNADSQSEGI